MEKKDGAIHFFSENTSYQLKHKNILRLWIRECLSAEGFAPGNINFIFCTDSFLLDLNQKYLSHETLTDIITFSFSKKPLTAEGDVYISIDRARENSRHYKVSLFNEMSRLLIHGVLHLVGYNDQHPEEKTRMTAKEDYYLSLLSI